MFFWHRLIKLFAIWILTMFIAFVIPYFISIFLTDAFGAPGHGLISIAAYIFSFIYAWIFCSSSFDDLNYHG